MPTWCFPGEFSGKYNFADEWDRVKRSLAVVCFLSIQAAFCGLSSPFLSPCCCAKLPAEPWQNQCGMRRTTIIMGCQGGTPYGPKLLPCFCYLQPPRQSFELSSHLQISVLLSPLWSGRTISLNQVWTDKKGCPCQLLPALSQASNKNKEIQEVAESLWRCLFSYPFIVVLFLDSFK